MTTTTQNGRHQKGRIVAPPAVTFSSGYTVTVHRLPPMTQQRVAEAVQRLDEIRGVKRPVVPMVEGAVAGQLEANEADPDYIAQVAAFDAARKLEFNDRLMLLVCLDAVEVEWTDALRAKVARTRRRLERVGAWVDDDTLEADERDTLIFVQHIAMEKGEDLQALYRAVMALSEPTPEVVEQHVETFPGDAPGA